MDGAFILDCPVWLLCAFFCDSMILELVGYLAV